MNDISIFWFLASLCFLLLEMGSPGLFYFLSFFFGSLAAAGATFAYESLLLQAGLFFGVSVLSFLILKIWVKKHFRHAPKTNVAALLGKRGTVIQAITLSQPGLVKIGGQSWSARCQQGAIKAGASVEVQQVTGAYLIVSEIKNS